MRSSRNAFQKLSLADGIAKIISKLTPINYQLFLKGVSKDFLRNYQGNYRKGFKRIAKQIPIAFASYISNDVSETCFEEIAEEILKLLSYQIVRELQN